MPDFKDIMSNKSNAELIEITTELREDYQSEAVEAAELELQNRNLDSSELNSAKEDLEQTKKDKSEKADIPLHGFWKAFVFIKPGIIHFFIATRMRGEGFDRKADELSRYTKFGYMFYGALIILIIILNKI